MKLPENFPQSDYTPFGYIDNPDHSAILNRSGSVRSVPPIGFGYWCRRLPWPYGEGNLRQINYLSFLHLSVVLDGKKLHTMQDFEQNGIELISRYHTKNMMSYDWTFNGVKFSAKYALPVENTIVCVFEMENSTKEVKTVAVHATNIYGYPEQRWWGCDGVTASYNDLMDAGISKIWAYGDVFIIGSDQKSAAHKSTASQDQWLEWISKNDWTSNKGTNVKMPGPLYTMQSYEFKLGAQERRSSVILLTRGVNEDQAQATYSDVLNNSTTLVNQKLAEDESFYNQVPHLTGAWPSEWKHGWVYDWETLRMNIRKPVGIFKHHWDAMQMHTPRLVLGETGFDGMCMSYADVSLAKDMFKAAFLDAPGLNVACSREDGSVNMICANGTEGATNPSWGYPFKVIKSIYERDQDAYWLKLLYPRLKSYLEWWLNERTDEAGWFHVNCSWEAQDASERFPVEKGAHPGDLVDYVRLIDIETSMAEAMSNMVLFARITGNSQDVPLWESQAQKRIENTRSMYQNGWFYDFDNRTNGPIVRPNYFDIMMFSPVTTGIASPEQMEGIKPMFYHFSEHPRHWLEWPSFLFHFTEASWNAGLRIFTAEELIKIGNRIYPRLDERKLQPILIPEFENMLPSEYNFRIPGISDEFWPLDLTNPGGCESYGWGSTFPMLIIRNIIGYREVGDPEQDAFILAPALPAGFFKKGLSYGMNNLDYRKIKMDITYTVENEKSLKIKITFRSDSPLHVAISGPDGKQIIEKQGTTKITALEFGGLNGNKYTCSIHP